MIKPLATLLLFAAGAGSVRYLFTLTGDPCECAGCPNSVHQPGDTPCVEPGSCCPEVDSLVEAAATPRGRYVEVRDASVFAGACHTNGESELQGRSALLFWALEAGSWDGVALDGLEVAAAVTSDANLARNGSRTALLFFDEAESAERVAAARAWLEETAAASLGTVAGVERVALTAELAGDAFAFRAAGVLEVSGTALADRSCCTMPESVWYEPVASVADPIVGNCDACSFEGGGELVAWAYPNENNAFVARFGGTCHEPGGCGPVFPESCAGTDVEE